MMKFFRHPSALYIFSWCLAAQLSALAADHNSGIKPIGLNHATGSAAAVVVDSAPLAHTAQMLPLNAQGELVGQGDAAKQMAQVWKNTARALREAGADIPQAVKLNVSAANAAAVKTAQQFFARKFSGSHQPAVAFVVGGLAHPDALVAMDAVAVSKIKSDAVQRFSSAAVLPKGGVVYISGQAEKGGLPEATAGTLKKLKETLDFLGLKKADVVQCKAFIQPISRVAEAKQEFAKFFAEDGVKTPPLVFVEWISSENLPIEIETIALSKNVKSSSAPVEYLTPPGVTPSPVYAKVVRVNHGKRVYLAGLSGNSSNQAAAEITEIYDALAQVLQQSGSDLKHLAKATYYVSNKEASSQLNALRPKYYDPQRPPAASKAMVQDVGVAGKGITLDMIGVSVK